MALTIEDGTGVAGADSYSTVTEIRAYATARGLALPVDDAAVEPLAVLATDWLETYRARYQGSQTSTQQPLQWPRSGVVIDGRAVADDEIPELLKRAQAQAAIDAQAAPLTARAAAGIRREKVDVIEVEYFQGSDSTARTGGSAIAEAMLAPLLRSPAVGVQVVRV